MTKNTNVNSFAAIVLAAGKGTRMQSSLPKVMHKVAGQPMLSHVLNAAMKAGADTISLVTSPEQEEVRNFTAEHAAIAVDSIQKEQLGTGHAVGSARETLKDYSGNIIILYGDTPLLCADTIANMESALRQNPELSLVVLGMDIENPFGYGRLIMQGDTLRGIVEEKDASDTQRAITLCNSGVMAARGDRLFDLIDALDNDNAKGEYYLTDIISIASERGLKCGVMHGDIEELSGVNSRGQLAEAEYVMQARLREQAMEAGATLIAPDTVFLSADTILGKDCIVHPHVVFGPEVVIGEGVQVKSFSHIEGTVIGDNAMIGPYARIRPGSNIGEDVKIGNFVELKKALVEKDAKISHLSYIGDAHIGEDANIGAGTITCNYDGYNKYHTEIGAGAFIGSNSALVAPVDIGAGAIIGAGSVITENIAADALGVARGRQESKDKWAAEFRKRQSS